MSNRSRRRQQKERLKQIADIISAAALLIIAVLMLVIVILYISNNSFLGSFLGITSSEKSSSAETFSDEYETLYAEETFASDGTAEVLYGLIRLADGNIVYAMDADEASAYDDDNLIDVTPESTASGEDVKSSAAQRYYLADSWLDLGGNLYHFNEDGYACLDSFSEGAFKFTYDDSGLLEKISYNRNFSQVTSQDGYPGLVTTKSLWVFIDTGKTLGSYSALKFKKTTETLSDYLGGSTNTQYASTYAYDIAGNKIFYLAAASDTSSSANDAVLNSITGKLFCMTPGADYREIAADYAEGFKVITDEDGTVIVYYYDGSSIVRTTDFVKDENMIIFSENADYVVDISSGSQAYLTTPSGQRVTMETSSFQSGNFNYALSAEGEILSVSSKETVSMNGYTYQVQSGTSFGDNMIRVVRTGTDAVTEVISAETLGCTYNIHYDFDTSSIIAEYKDNNNSYGLLRISLDGDIDYITGSKSIEAVELYAIQNGTAIFRTMADEAVIFRSADISIVSPLSAGIDPVELESDETAEEAETIAPQDYDTTNSETIAPVETVSSSSPQTETSGGNIISSGGPGSVSIINNGPGGGLSIDTVGPGGN